MSDNIPPPWANAIEERLLAAVAALCADMATRTNIADIMARIDRLQEDPTPQRENSVVELRTADMALRKNENTRKEVEALTEMALALTEQVRHMDAELRQLRGDGEDRA
jgi:hypothetical protein